MKKLELLLVMFMLAINVSYGQGLHVHRKDGKVIKMKVENVDSISFSMDNMEKEENISDTVVVVKKDTIVVEKNDTIIIEKKDTIIVEKKDTIVVEKINTIIHEKIVYVTEDGTPIPQFFFNVGTSIPSTEAEIEARDANGNYINHHATTTSGTFNYNSGNAISCEEFGQKAIWVAMPKNWSLSSWKEMGLGSEMKNDFIEATSSSDIGENFMIIGNYKIYWSSVDRPVGLLNSFKIIAIK